MAKGQIGLSPRQQRLGVPKVRPVDEKRYGSTDTRDERRACYIAQGQGKNAVCHFKLHAVLEDIINAGV